MGLVREMGFEPTRLSFVNHWNLNPTRLPVPPLPHKVSVFANFKTTYYSINLYEIKEFYVF